MPATLAQPHPITLLPAILPDYIVVCLFSLLGLTLSAGVLSYASFKTIGMIFSLG